MTTGQTRYIATFYTLAICNHPSFQVAAWVKRKWGLDAEASLRAIEAKHRETLHWALQTGITSAAVRAGVLDLASMTTDQRFNLAREAVEYATTPVYKDGTLVGTVITYRDITERKRMEAEIKRTNFLAAFERVSS